MSGVWRLLPISPLAYKPISLFHPIQEAKKAQSRYGVVHSKPAGSLHVLVVEDESFLREVLAEFLEQDGHTFEPATNAREGLTKFRAGRFDLVITDRAMPDMSGDWLALGVKQLNPNIPVVMLTGFGNIMQASGELPAGVDAIVSKPISIEEFREALSRVSNRPFQ